MTKTIDEMVKDGDFAAIMRECFALLEKRHADAPGMAYQQNVQLRTYLQSLYNSQPKKNPVGIAALAGYAYKFLEDGSTVDRIKDVPSLQFLQHSRELEHTFEPYNADYTTLPILDDSKDLHSADTEPIQQGSLIYVPHDGTRFDPREGSILPGEALKKLQSQLDLSPTDKVTAAMQKIVDKWAQRQGLKGSDDV